MTQNIKKTLLVSLAALPSTIAFGQNDDRPNILFILSDDHTSQGWGVYGGILEPYVKNDNIKRLANEGCLMENVFCTNSISVPSRAAILTGQFSHFNGVKTLADGLDPERDNIAKRLQEVGYNTAVIGKWHLKREPSGYNYYSVFYDQGDYINPKFKTAEDWQDSSLGPSGVMEEGFSTDLVTDKVIKYLDKRDKDQPFLMFCNFKATHEPWDFPERMKHIYDGVTFPEPENLFDGSDSERAIAGQQLENLAIRWETASKDPDKWWCKYPELPFSREGMDSITARKAVYQKLIRDYLRCGATVDDNIGRLLDYLDKEGIADNTIVVYVADQGYFLGEHGFFDKRLMYEESLRMPFVIRYPREIPAGSRNSDFVQNIDFAPLMADYAQAKEPNDAQGKSFRENLKGNTPKNWRENVYYRYWTQNTARPAHFGIRNDRYKLIFYYGHKLDEKGYSNEPFTPSWEFFDLERDPKENTNLYSDPAYADVIKDMKQDLLKEKKAAGDSDKAYPVMREIMDQYYW